MLRGHNETEKGIGHLTGLFVSPLTGLRVFRGAQNIMRCTGLMRAAGRRSLVSQK